MALQVHVPARDEQPLYPVFNYKDVVDLPVVRFLHIAVTLLVGWPLYVTVNITGRAYDSYANHFDPYSPIFTKKERSEIVVSDAAVAVAVYGLFLTGQAFGWSWFCKVGSCGLCRFSLPELAQRVSSAACPALAR